MKKLKILDIGCGKEKYNSSMNEVKGLDIVKLPGIDIVHNLNETPYPFNDNEFDLIISKHVLEHLDNLIDIMMEIYRILKPNGIFYITVPYYSSAGAFQDPTHVRFFTFRTFDYFTEEFKLSYYFDQPLKFKIIRKRFIPYSSFWKKSLFYFMNKHQHFYESYISKILPPKEFEVILKKVNLK